MVPPRVVEITRANLWSMPGQRLLIILQAGKTGVISGVENRI